MAEIAQRQPGPQLCAKAVAAGVFDAQNEEDPIPAFERSWTATWTKGPRDGVLEGGDDRPEPAHCTWEAEINAKVGAALVATGDDALSNERRAMVEQPEGAVEPTAPVPATLLSRSRSSGARGSPRGARSVW